MKAVLTCEIPIQRFAVFAEMAWLERRPELGLLCKAALSSNRRISNSIIQQKLPGTSDTGAKNIIAWCHSLGLCDAQGGLTASGEDTAESNEAPVPEQGVYDLWVAKHPLLGTRIVAALRLASTRDQRFETIVSLPVVPGKNVIFTSLVSSQERFLLRDIPSNSGQLGAIIGKTRGRCGLRWVLDFDKDADQWQLSGALDTAVKEMKPIQHKPEHDGLSLWPLMEVWGAGPLAAFGTWSAQQRRLAVRFSEKLSAASQDSFTADYELPHADIPGKGSYKQVKLTRVPIGPASKGDAQRWAQVRLLRKLRGEKRYLSRGEIRSTFVDLTENTPLEEHGPTLPAHRIFMDWAQKNNERELFWRTVAPVDLAPSPVPEEDLRPLRIGVAAQSPAVTSGSLRIPYGSRWSMQQLVSLLSGNTSPSKVLLCDPYVRSVSQLEMLGLMVAAFRQISSSTRVEVWTRQDDTDLDKIRELTGTTPRRYQDVFKALKPHDRYVLIQPGSRQAFGWQLSNSPLHAHSVLPTPSPQTALRWKDLSGLRVRTDSLVPALRQWLGETA